MPTRTAVAALTVQSTPAIAPGGRFVRLGAQSNDTSLPRPPKSVASASVLSGAGSVFNSEATIQGEPSWSAAATQPWCGQPMAWTSYQS